VSGPTCAHRLEKEDCQAGEGELMKLEGWIFFILSWGFILALCIYCFTRIFSKK
jgi:hypothetical protein